MSFNTLYEKSEMILTEGALVERLKSEFNLVMDDRVNHAGLIYSKPEILELLYRQYIDVGRAYDLPVMIMTPTRKVNQESKKRSAFRDKDLVTDSCNLLNRIRENYDAYARKIMIGGLLGCKGDAYRGEQILDAEEAFMFHKHQADQFKDQKIDFLFAGIMPEIQEATGMARAMADTGIPYIISFMIRKDGCLLDGTAIADAVRIIDERVDPVPVCYMANCIHPTNLIEALNNDKNRNSPQLRRFKGIQANASTLSCEELDNCDVLHQDDFTVMIDKMLFLQKHYDLKIFGGCCGTNHEFMEGLTKKIARAIKGKRSIELGENERSGNIYNQ